MLFSSPRSRTVVLREDEKTANTKVSATQFDAVSLNYIYQSMVYNHIFFYVYDFCVFLCLYQKKKRWDNPSRIFLAELF